MIIGIKKNISDSSVLELENIIQNDKFNYHLKSPVHTPEKASKPQPLIKHIHKSEDKMTFEEKKFINNFKYILGKNTVEKDVEYVDLSTNRNKKSQYGDIENMKSKSSLRHTAANSNFNSNPNVV